MRITWEVEDGYVGKSRPHEINVDYNDLAGCETVDEAKAVIEDAVQADFDNTVSWVITGGLDEEEIKRLIEENR